MTQLAAVLIGLVLVGVVVGGFFYMIVRKR